MADNAERFQSFRQGVSRTLGLEFPFNTDGETVKAALIRGDDRNVVGQEEGVVEGETLILPIVFGVQPGMYELEVYGDSQGILFPQNETTIRVFVKNNEYDD